MLINDWPLTSATEAKATCGGSEMESYAGVVRRIRELENAPVSIPELSILLGVKTTTLNARLRRQRVPVRIVGRTNFIPGGLALKLAELHKHALIGWPTLLQASQICGIKPGTLKARCEKGQLESYRDLTKRLRINPTELGGLRLRPRASRARILDSRIATTRTSSSAALSQSQANGVARVNTRILRPSDGSTSAPRWGSPSSDRHAPRAPVPDLSGFPTWKGPRSRVEFAPEIQLISEKDYGLPIPDGRSENAGGCQQRPTKSRERLQGLYYNPDRPFPISACAVGKSVHYDNYDGTIVGIFDDPFCPRIKVRFANAAHPLMKEVLLRVGKPNGA